MPKKQLQQASLNSINYINSINLAINSYCRVFFIASGLPSSVFQTDRQRGVAELAIVCRKRISNVRFLINNAKMQFGGQLWTYRDLSVHSLADHSSSSVRLMLKSVVTLSKKEVPLAKDKLARQTFTDWTLRGLIFIGFMNVDSKCYARVPTEN